MVFDYDPSKRLSQNPPSPVEWPKGANVPTGSGTGSENRDGLALRLPFASQGPSDPRNPMAAIPERDTRTPWSAPPDSSSELQNRPSDQAVLTPNLGAAQGLAPWDRRPRATPTTQQSFSEALARGFFPNGAYGSSNQRRTKTGLQKGRAILTRGTDSRPLGRHRSPEPQHGSPGQQCTPSNQESAGFSEQNTDHALHGHSEHPHTPTKHAMHSRPWWQPWATPRAMSVKEPEKGPPT